MDLFFYLKVVQLRTELKHILLDLEEIIDVNHDMHVSGARMSLMAAIETLSNVQPPRA